MVINQRYASSEEQLKVILEAKGFHEIAPHGQGNVYAPSVLIEGNIWKMWYGAQVKDGHYRIFYAESNDGISWMRKGLLLKDAKANHLNDPSVIKVGPRYYMYFTKAEKDVIDRIFVAFSDDGRDWSDPKLALKSSKSGAWDSISTCRPSVIFDQGFFKMWYDGR